MFIQLSEKSFIRTESILSVHATGSSQIKRVIESAIAEKRYVDTTRKKPTRSTIITKENFVYDTTLLPETLVKRIIEAEKEMETVNLPQEKEEQKPKPKQQQRKNNYYRNKQPNTN